ncbi:hypothetical protein UY3_05129 [Chelonia mydas]|uniref:Uncharacterized protein n=1 Tax=Chelonia mydas TaxID=8469 RepID=M7BKD6_CHEMY|nr:hypothetical protein UY3_05129 [Chelonia mydas]
MPPPRSDSGKKRHRRNVAEKWQHFSAAFRRRGVLWAHKNAPVGAMAPAEVLKEQHSDAETTEPKPPKKKINFLLVVSDSDDENEHVSVHSALNRYRAELVIRIQDRRSEIDPPAVDLAGLVKTRQIDSRWISSRPLYSTPDEKSKGGLNLNTLMSFQEHTERAKKAHILPKATVTYNPDGYV